ncbi:MAG TPA: nuclear transport factor 2 family protein, partial [Solirubrobacterales bacterium]|nr:nuclear transport factor 2 family protein [Solirubrobacterales bacterium]
MPSEESSPPVELVQRWAAAWNACDADGILELAHPEFRMHRMKGDVIDRDGLKEAVQRQTYGAAMKLHPLRLYQRGEQCAVAARIEYRHVEEDELIGATDDGGMAVELKDGLVVLAAPQPTCAEALSR